MGHSHQLQTESLVTSQVNFMRLQLIMFAYIVFDREIFSFFFAVPLVLTSVFFIILKQELHDHVIPLTFEARGKVGFLLIS